MINKQALITELKKREKKADKKIFNFDEYTFDAQKKFFRGSKNRFKVTVCSRRSGKTVGIVADMLDTCIQESSVNLLYITQTQQAARAIIWDDLMRIIDEYEMDCKVDNSRLTITFPNKSKIYIAGAKDQSEISKYRGWKLRKCYIDEAQSFRSYISELINDIIIPALRDLRGDLYITGTPGVVCAGPYYEYSQSSEWARYNWTAFDNIHMHNPPEIDLEETLAEERIIRGIDENDPSYIRETFGKWVEDLDQLVFKFNRSRNIYTELPTEGEWTYILGADIGYNDSDAIAIIGYNSFAKKVFLVDEFVKNKLTITDFVKHIKRFVEEYSPVKMVMDAGALGKKIQEEIRQRHGIHLEAAEKSRKVEFIELLNDDLRTGKFMAFNKSLFQEDSMLVQWDKDSKLRNPERPKISDNYHSDICDAVLYSWREAKHYLSEKPFQAPKINTNEYMDQMERKEAEDMEHKKKDPMGYEFDKAMEEEDEDFLDSIMDIY